MLNGPPFWPRCVTVATATPRLAHLGRQRAVHRVPPHDVELVVDDPERVADGLDVVDLLEVRLAPRAEEGAVGASRPRSGGRVARRPRGGPGRRCRRPSRARDPMRTGAGGCRPGPRSGCRRSRRARRSGAQWCRSSAVPPSAVGSGRGVQPNWRRDLRRQSFDRLVVVRWIELRDEAAGAGLDERADRIDGGRRRGPPQADVGDVVEHLARPRLDRELPLELARRRRRVGRAGSPSRPASRRIVDGSRPTVSQCAASTPSSRAELRRAVDRTTRPATGRRAGRRSGGPSSRRSRRRAPAAAGAPAAARGGRRSNR